MMIFDRSNLAFHIGTSGEDLIFSYTIGFPRTQTVTEEGQIVGPKPEVPLGGGKLGKMSKESFAVTCDSEDSFLEKVWALWKSNARSRPLCLSLSKAEYSYELFSRAISKDLPRRRKAGPNPIADVRSLTKLPGCPKWEKTRAFKEFLPTFWNWKNSLVESPYKLFTTEPIVITFDVEAWGLFSNHPFSIGGGVFCKGNCIERWHFTCPPDSAHDDSVIEKDAEWVREHVLPHHPESTTYSTPDEIIAAFRNRFNYWKKFCHKKDITIVTLAGRGFPLEARLLKHAGMIQEFFDTRAWALVFDIKVKRDTEAHPLHHPVDDAEVEVDVWEAIRKLIES